MSYVFTADCTACGACLLTCPEHAIVVGLPLSVREDRCTSCGECVEVCPADAVLELPTPTPTPAPPADHGVLTQPHAQSACHNSMISAGWGVGAA